jgi:uncharacterized protein (DUF3084 family)
MSDANKNTTPDQGDVLAQLEAARGEIVTLKAEKATLTGERDKAKGDLATVTTERDNAKAELVTEKGKVKTLEGEKATLTQERDNYKALSEPVQKQLAAKLVEHGISTPGAKADEKANDGKKLTATEKLLASKGVKSLADLGKKPAAK